MEISESLLKQVAKLCRLEFTDEQYALLVKEFARSLTDVEVIFSVPSAEHVAKDTLQPPDNDDIAFSKLRA